MEWLFKTTQRLGIEICQLIMDIYAGGHRRYFHEEAVSAVGKSSLSAQEIVLRLMLPLVIATCLSIMGYYSVMISL